MQTDQLSHFPVMVNEVVSFLEPKKEKIYLDCTFGQGGYSKKILESAECKVCAIDRDSDSNNMLRFYHKNLILDLLSVIQNLVILIFFCTKRISRPLTEWCLILVFQILN